MIQPISGILISGCSNDFRSLHVHFDSRNYAPKGRADVVDSRPQRQGWCCRLFSSHTRAAFRRLRAIVLGSYFCLLKAPLLAFLLVDQLVEVNPPSSHPPSFHIVGHSVSPENIGAGL